MALSNKTLKDVIENDIRKEEIATSNGIQNYIILDCRYSNADWIKNSIMHSELPNLFGFNVADIDWNLCDKFASGNRIKMVCDDFYSKKLFIDELAEKYKVSKQSIINYLYKGNEFGWCNYVPQSGFSIPVVVTTPDKNCYYFISKRQAAEFISKIWNLSFTSIMQYGCSNGIYKGFVIKPIEDRELKHDLLYGNYDKNKNYFINE